MKIPLFSCLWAMVALGSGPSAFAAGYSTNFNTFLNGNIQGQDGWEVDTTTSPGSGNPGSISSGYGITPWGTRTALIGYAVNLSQDDVYVSRPVSVPMVGSVATTFSANFAIYDSDAMVSGAYNIRDARRDTFGFRFEDSAGNNIFSFMLKPYAQNPNPENTTGFWEYFWSTGADPIGNQLIFPLSSQEATTYLLNLSFTAGSGSNVNFAGTVGSQSFGGVIPNASAATIARMGAFWDTNYAPNPGSNFMYFDNVSIVPEPSFSLLGLLGVSLTFARRRRD